MYRQGGVIGKSNIPTTGGASGLWRINEIQNAELDARAFILADAAFVFVMFLVK